jgi:hypothetical protein
MNALRCDPEPSAPLAALPIPRYGDLRRLAAVLRSARRRRTCRPAIAPDATFGRRPHGWSN